MITAVMNSRYTTFKPRRKAPRPSRVWSGPWSASTVLHEFEFQHGLLNDRRAATAPKDIYDTRAINYGSLFITILGLSIFTTITFLRHVLVLLFPRPSPCRFCCTLGCPEGVPDRGIRQGSQLSTLTMGLRNMRNRCRCYPRHTYQL